MKISRLLPLLGAGLLTALTSGADAQDVVVTRGSIELAIQPLDPMGNPATTNFRVGDGTGLDFDTEFIGNYSPNDFVQLRDIYAFFDVPKACKVRNAVVTIELRTQQTTATGQPVVSNRQQVNLNRQSSCPSQRFRQVGVPCTSTLVEYGAPGTKLNIGLLAYDNAGLVDLRITWTPISRNCNVKPLTATATLTVSADVSLPAELTAFSAAAEASADLVSWSTASEVDVDRFLVERSVDGGTDFEVVAEEAARGDASRAVDYAVSVAAAGGTRYYRLVTVDEDGSTATSDVAVVTSAAKASGLVVYPNPALDIVHLAPAGLSDGTAEIRVFDALGRLVIERTAQLASGEFELDASALAAGRYSVSVSSGQQTLTQAFQVAE